MSSRTGRFDGLFDLTGRTALVTGSSQGIGLELARGLAGAGAALVLNGRDQAKLAAALSRLETETGPVDILVNNAGIHQRAPLAEMTEAQWRQVLDTNLTGAFLVARALAPRMIARQRGKIINVCSLMSEVARPTTGNYAAAKGGLKMLTRAMAVEWARHNLQINAIGPGYIDTELTRPLLQNAEFNQWICGRTPAGRWGRPEDLVGAVVFLAAPASNFVNGQIIYVDGGLLAAV